MVKYTQIDVDSPFAIAFTQVGMHWASYIVSFGAVTGITTSLLVSILGQSRIYVTLGREGLVPAFLAKVSDKTGTPVNATLFTMCSAGAFALILDIEVLASLVSIGTLFVFFMVRTCGALLH
jgi:basic amino acid/polyamine antiporter, APA family